MSILYNESCRKKIFIQDVTDYVSLGIPEAIRLEPLSNRRMQQYVTGSYSQELITLMNILLSNASATFSSILYVAPSSCLTPCRTNLFVFHVDHEQLSLKSGKETLIFW